MPLLVLNYQSNKKKVNEQNLSTNKNNNNKKNKKTNEY